MILKEDWLGLVLWFTYNFAFQAYLAPSSSPGFVTVVETLERKAGVVESTIPHATVRWVWMLVSIARFVASYVRWVEGGKTVDDNYVATFGIIFSVTAVHLVRSFTFRMEEAGGGGWWLVRMHLSVLAFIGTAAVFVLMGTSRSWVSFGFYAPSLIAAGLMVFADAQIITVDGTQRGMEDGINNPPYSFLSSRAIKRK